MNDSPTSDVLAEALFLVVPWKSNLLNPIVGFLDADAYEKALAAQLISTA